MNRLATESSPYLRQHAENPVDWYPWGYEAFARAVAEDKPVLLSVGYSSCHWCHVMAHESFEDPATAAVMNRLFVNIKVDREERPDVDAIYMEAVQAVSGQGGWPMTVFLTPDGRPFFAGTYYPKESFGGRPGFVQLLESVEQAWREQRSDVNEQADALREAVEARTHAEPGGADVAAQTDEWLASAKTAFVGAADKEWGGFGAAPKFPQTSALEFLLREGSDESLDIVTNSLDAMASGGIYDHLGGGFSRYSVDAFWMVPHFEKMLYDQAAFVSIYTHAYQRTGEPRFRQVVEETVGYVLRELTSDGGGFYAAEDADSEGEEGKFYVWRPEEIEAALGDMHLNTAAFAWYGVTRAGNFEGSNILHRPVRGDIIRPPEVEEARRRLLTARNERVHPGLDDKVVSEWNAMFIAALAQAGAAMDRPDWISAATSAGEFLLQSLRSKSGRWMRSWHSVNGAKNLAVANDYAWLVDAFTRLGEATGQARWRTHAIETADAMIELFWDDEHGGLFTVGGDAEQLIVRSKDIFDGASPSANSTAALGLLRLSMLTSNYEYMKRAVAIIELVAQPMANHPTAFAHFLNSVQMLASDATETVIAGDHVELVKALQARYAPNNVLAWGERDESLLWEGRTDGAYVCRNQTCGLPALNVDEMLKQLA